MARNAQVIRQIQIICRLLDGRPKMAIDFEDIYEGLHPRTMRRDFDALLGIPEARIKVSTRGEMKWYRMDVPPPTKVKRTEKVCSKCPERGKQPMENFGDNTYSPDGKNWTCRDCKRKQRNEWAKNNRTHVNAKQRRNYRKRVEKRKKEEQLK